LRSVLLAALLFFAAPALASIDTYERITDYDSDVTIEKSGSLDVVETIKVVVADDEIKHGIFRDFPTEYTNRLGRHVHVDFSVLSVTRDGNPEPYETTSVDHGQRILIGDKDRILDPGTYTYRITYTTTRQIGFFDKYDELYWNATGNFWEFVIEHATATIHLPPGAHIVQSSFYTGGEGETKKNATSEVLSDDAIRFTTTEALAPREGLTVAVAFNKGVVPPPTPAEERANFIRDNGAPITALMGLFILLVYFGATWWEFGRDPKQGPIVPLFSPPDNLSPAAVRYLHRMAYDRKAYAATLINLAVKGYLTIGQDDGAYVLTRTGRSEGECGLAPTEAQVAAKLFDGDMSVVMKQENHSQIAASITALKSALKSEYEKSYFVTNLHWFIGGLAILAITALAAALQSEDGGATSGIYFWLGGWTVGTAFIVHNAYEAWLGVRGPGLRITNIFGALFMSAFALAFVGGECVGLFMLSTVTSPLLAVLLALGGLMSYVFYHLLKAPTLLGAKTRDQIDGLRMYLNAAEKDRLEVLNPPNITPAVFEKLLPYAIALDCENRWSKQFEAEAERAGQAAGASQGGYVPIWWAGMPSSFGSYDFASSIGASLAASAASASTAPGSSSGSGGGGFSGGGGGGGGGGGW
jgi:uncharacterized membrane protein YgcG